MAGGGVSAVVCVLLFKSSEVSLRAPFVRLGAPLPHYSHPFYRNALLQGAGSTPFKILVKPLKRPRRSNEFTEVLSRSDRVLGAGSECPESRPRVLGTSRASAEQGHKGWAPSVDLYSMRDEWGAFGRCHDWH